MEDREIVALYWRRDEEAIAQTDRKYGPLCHALARNILTLREDAEECVADTYHHAWNAMPTQRPERLGVWLGRVVRNLAIDRYHQNRAQKRDCALTVLLSELEDCVPAPQSVERTVESAELGCIIDRWLGTLPPEDRTLFVERYWYGEAVKALAARAGAAPGTLTGRLYRLRRSLRRALEQEGITI